MYFISKTIKQKPLQYWKDPVRDSTSNWFTHQVPCEREKELKQDIESISFYHHIQNQKIGFHWGQKKVAAIAIFCVPERKNQINLEEK